MFMIKVVQGYKDGSMKLCKPLYFPRWELNQASIELIYTIMKLTACIHIPLITVATPYHNWLDGSSLMPLNFRSTAIYLVSQGDS